MTTLEAIEWKSFLYTLEDALWTAHSEMDNLHRPDRPRGEHALLPMSDNNYFKPRENRLTAISIELLPNDCINALNSLIERIRAERKSLSQ